MNRLQLGKNVIVEKKFPSDLVLAVSQLQSPLIYILLLASVITFYLGDYIDTGIILLAVVINTFLGFIQERKAQRGLAALRKILTPKARVIRDNQLQTIEARDLVVEDVILVGAGDRIPADGVLLEAVNLYLNEAILTGESAPVEKTVKGERNVFMGTVVTSGRGKFRVAHIGMDTKLGNIASALEETPEEATPLEHQLQKLAHLLARMVVVICLFIFVIGVIRGENTVTMFTLAVAIAVAAIPEGMVVSLTVILSLGMQRILKHHSLVRRLVSAETLGSVTALCVDKTGTLTEGVMRVVATQLTDKGLAMQAAVLANNLKDPIEMALWEWVQGQNHCDPQQLTETAPRLHEIPFDGTRKYMLVQTATGVWVKGAPEILLEKSNVPPKTKGQWLTHVNKFAQHGLRVIGLAWKPPKGPTLHKREMSDLTFLGVVGVSDPLRENVKEALGVCRRAGVVVKVVTGDYRLTSEVIMRQLDLTISDASVEIMEGKELHDISLDDLIRRVGHIKLFCRVTPDQKLKIVEALQRSGEVVAMTGDGVNDALALKKADIGIVVATAQDVAKETADVVLLDSNFRTIVAAIEEGRVIFANIRKVVLYLLSDAFTEMLLIIASILAFVPLPLTAIQILWINILSDGFPNLALAVEPKEHDVMHALPRPKSAPVVDLQLKVLILMISSFKALFAFVIFLLALWRTADLLWAQTLTFAVVGTGSLLYVFSTRSLSRPIFKVNVFKNPWLIVAVGTGLALQLLVIYHPWLASIFRTRPLKLFDWTIVLGTGILLISIIEATKHVFLKKKFST